MKLLWVLISLGAFEKAEGNSDASFLLRSKLTGNEKKWISEKEATLWYEICKGDEEEAFKKMKNKAQWRASIGRVSMTDCAQFFGSDGFTVCLEPLRDCKNKPIVFSYGIPRGSVEQIRAQTIYLQERILARAHSINEAAAMTIIDTRATSFRAPDKALRYGGINVIDEYYPWANSGSTVFVALPPFIRQFIKMTKPLFPKETYDRFNFVNDFHELAPTFISSSNLPRRWGGQADFSLRYYVPARCLKEGVFCRPAPRNL
mmetsp:Transcript_8074/g.12336  ORF Transcript_8074/g.12336 Transcript_8074/m.12336 type:complete len:260 (+) Transcript_8074:46-825(+)